MYDENGYKEGTYGSPPRQKHKREKSVKWTPIPMWKLSGWAGYFTLKNFIKEECVELGEWCDQRDFKDWRFADATGNFDAMNDVDITNNEVEDIFNGNLRVYFKNKTDATMFRFTWGG